MTAVQNSNGKMINIKNEDILKWVSGESKSRVRNKKKHTLPIYLLSNLEELADRCSIKKNMNEEDFSEFSFLKINFNLDIPEKLRSVARGVTPDKKNDIISNLVH